MIGRVKRARTCGISTMTTTTKKHIEALTF
jgi:hypothetical protein